jgi:hypothetical protein
MRTVKLMGLAVLALFAFAASGAYAVEAEESNNPRILCLVEKCSELEGTLKGGVSRLEDLAGKTIEGTAAEAKLKGCENLAGNKDINLCFDVPIHFTGTKKEKVACRSENAKGEKDPVEVILALLDLHMAAELTSASVLQPLLLAKVLGTDLTETLTINCGVVKTTVKGQIGCLLLPGLANIPTTTAVEVVCALNKEKHDPVTGTCNVLCTDFGATIGLISTLDGKTETDSWEEIKLSGNLNKDIFIDD